MNEGQWELGEGHGILERDHLQRDFSRLGLQVPLPFPFIQEGLCEVLKRSPQVLTRLLPPGASRLLPSELHNGERKLIVIRVLHLRFLEAIKVRRHGALLRLIMTR